MLLKRFAPQQSIYFPIYTPTREQPGVQTRSGLSGEAVFLGMDSGFRAPWTGPLVRCFPPEVALSAPAKSRQQCAPDAPGTIPIRDRYIVFGTENTPR